jgi:ferrous iron transport protein A
MMPLHALKPGQVGKVVQLRSTDTARLHKLSLFGVVPGSQVRLAQTQPVVIFSVDETEISIDLEVAAEIIVVES